MSLVRSNQVTFVVDPGAASSGRRDPWKTSAPLCAAALVMASLAGGCSTDVSRFDLPVLGVSEGAAPPPGGRQGVGGPPASLANDAVVRPAPRDGAGPLARGSVADGNSVAVANLPDNTVAQAKIPPDVAPPRRAAARPVTTAAVPSAPAPSTTPAGTQRGGQTVEVAAGDTLYKLSTQYRVPISDLMTANGLQSPAIKPGQKLVIPTATAAPLNRVPTRAEAQQRATQQAVQTMRPAGAPEAPAAGAPAIAGNPVGGPAAGIVTPPAPPGGNYTVQAGESFYSIARKHKVKAEELAQLNGVTDVAKIRQGQVLKIPTAGTVAAVAPTGTPPTPVAPGSAAPARVGAAGTKFAALGNAASVPAAPAAPPAPTAGLPGSDAAPAFDQSETAAAAQGRTEPAKTQGGAVQQVSAPAAAASAGTGFRWPVKGKVITKFGPKEDGSHNDGINIAVPLGTDVQAAESGVVAYAGNELKGYGNLILIRHDENWVSAYAHSDQLLVKRGDKVKRGQIIAKAGKTGTVEQPQVHFELRQGSKPVDPMKHLVGAN